MPTVAPEISRVPSQAAPDELTRREMFAEIKKLCEPNNWTNAWVILREYLVLAAVIAGCSWSYHALVAERGLSLWWMVPIYALTIFIIGAWTQNRLSVLVHEASHYSLFKNRLLNDIAANLFLLFPVFGAIANYRMGHWGHHRHVNDPQHDPDLHRLVRHHARDFPIPKWKFFFDYVLLQVLVQNAISYIKGRALYVAIPMKIERVANQDALGTPVVWTMRVVYYGTLAAVFTIFDLWVPYLLFWVVPFITFYPAVLFLREIAHHGNYPDSGDFTNSRVYDANWLERGIFFPFGEHNHVLHHMFPTIPHHKMDLAHQTMLRYPAYRDTVVFCNGFFVKADRTSDSPTVLDVLAAPADRYLRGRSTTGAAGEIRHATEQEVGGIRSAPLM